MVGLLGGLPLKNTTPPFAGRSLGLGKVEIGDHEKAETQRVDLLRRL